MTNEEKLDAIAIVLANTANELRTRADILETRARALGLKWCRVCNRVLDTGPSTICNSCESREELEKMAENADTSRW